MRIDILILFLILINTNTFSSTLIDYFSSVYDFKKESVSVDIDKNNSELEQESEIRIFEAIQEDKIITRDKVELINNGLIYCNTFFGL